MKIKRIENNILVTFAISLGICIVSTLAISFILAIIANASENSTGNIPLFAMISLIVSAVVSGISISRLKGAGGVKLTALASLAFVLMMLLVSVIASKGAVSASAFMNYLCYMGVSLLSAYLGRSRGKSARRRR